MQTIKQYAEANNIQPNKLLNYLIPKYPKAGLKLESALPEDFAQYADDIAKIAEKVQEQTKTPPVANIGESAITTTDQAIQEASYKLVESERLITEETIAVRRSIGDLTYGAAGVELALRNLTTLNSSEQAVVAAFQEEALDFAEEQLQKTEQAVIDLASEAGKMLGKQIAQKRSVDSRVEQMRSRLQTMGVAIARIRQ
jgi:hypothetical protein